MPILSSEVSYIYPALGRIDPDSIEPLAVAAMKWIQGRYGRDLTAGAKTDRFDSHYDAVIWLKCPPVTEVTEIRVNDAVMPGWESYVRVSPEGRLSIKNRPIWLDGSTSPLGRFWNQMPGFAPGIDNIEIDYVSAGATQAELNLYVGAVVNWWADANRRSPVALSESIGDRSYSIGQNAEIPASVKTVLSSLIPKRAG